MHCQMDSIGFNVNDRHKKDGWNKRNSKRIIWKIKVVNLRAEEKERKAGAAMANNLVGE